MSEKQKRPRSSNFTIFETEVLVDEVLKRSPIIEDKTTDATTWANKEKAWTNLAQSFNAITGTNRSVKMLKSKYDGIKRAIKRKHAANKMEQLTTGGGIARITKFHAWEEKIMQLISLSVEGLACQNNSDFGIEEVSSCSDAPTATNTTCLERSPVTLVDVKTEVVPEAELSTSIAEDMAEPKAETATEEAPGSPAPVREFRPYRWTGEAARPKPNTNPRTSRQSSTKSVLALQQRYVSLAERRQDLVRLQNEIAEKEMEKVTKELEGIESANALKMHFMAVEHEKRMEILELEKQLLLKKCSEI